MGFRDGERAGEQAGGNAKGPWHRTHVICPQVIAHNHKASPIGADVTPRHCQRHPMQRAEATRVITRFTQRDDFHGDC